MIKQILRFINNILFFIRRKIRINDDPLVQHRKRYRQIDEDIRSKDSKQATTNATNDLDELDRLQKHKTDPDRSDGDKNREGF